MPTTHKIQKFEYIPSLDNVRGFAIIFVLLIHVSYGIIKGGWVGVNLFFVLSGYLITSLLQAEYNNSGKISILKFYARRALRLFPPLIIGVLIANILWVHNAPIYPYGNQLLATMAALFYFINLIPRPFAGSLIHLWSLSVEEHFYLVWPLLTSFFLFRLSIRNRIICIFILILAASAFKIYESHFSLRHISEVIVIDPSRFTLCSLDSILTGALLAVALIKPEIAGFTISNKTSTWLLVVLSLIFTVILFKVSGNGSYNRWGFILIDILCASTVFVAIKNPTHYLLSNKIVKWIGVRSYGLYVYHYPIFAACESFRKPNSVSNFILIAVVRLVISFIVAGLSYKYIEQPILKFKKRLAVAKVKPSEGDLG